MSYRDTMIENQENLEWCKPLSFLGGRVIVALNEGQITCISVDGKTLPSYPENVHADSIRTAAKLVNPEYDEYSGWPDTHILLEADYEELPCCKCPWFDVCDAMDD